jgi:hypothetical protein
MTKTLIRTAAVAALLAAASTPALASNADYAAPYRLLQQANRTLDPALATSAYATEGVLVFDIPGAPAESFRGHDAIRAAYVRSFRQVDPGTPIALEFRFEGPVRPAPHKGAYRLTAKIGGREIVAYGRFTASLVWDRNAWRFAEDRGTAASAADYEALPPADL